ncbi:MAG: InlB B-repeat-containing protein [Clostridia bacterium]|nr:InlB B-repeat-containing protein [Clostridia bacterium]
MKKTKKIVALAMSVITVSSAFAFSACNEEHTHTNNGKWAYDNTQHWHVATCEEHEGQKYDNADHHLVDGKCDVCDYVNLSAPVITIKDNVISWAAVPNATNYEVFEGATSLGKQTETSYTINKTEEGTYNYTVKALAGESASAASNSVSYKYVTPVTNYYTVEFTFDGNLFDRQTIVEGEKVTAVEAVPQRPGYTFTKWKNEDGTDYNFNSPVTKNLTLKAGWKRKDGGSSDVSGTEQVKTTLDIQAAADEISGVIGTTAQVNIPSGGYTYREKFTFAGGRFEPGNSAMNTQTTAVTIKLTGSTNSIKLVAKGASGSGASRTVKAPDGTVLGTYSDVANNVSFTFEQSGLAAGVYTFAGSGSVRITELSVTEELEKSLPSSMVANASKTDFLVGETFSSTGLNASVKYKNDSYKNQTELTVDSSSVDTTKPGEYVVRAFYTESGETVTAAYVVTVYKLESLTLHTFVTNGNKQTNFQTVFVQGAANAVKADGLTVNGVATCGEKSVTVKLNTSQYEIGNVDFTTIGEKTLTVTSKADAKVKGELKVYVVAAPQVENNMLTIGVDKSKPVSSANFHTISDALNYVKASGVADTVNKVINIADGEYNEKVSVDTPNVKLIGSATATPDATTNNGVVIWYDAIAGGEDPSGSAYGTNGSGTVSVTSKATGFVAENITFKNYYNTKALYDLSLTISGNSQAVALFIESTQAEFYNCKMTSYHDTLYANKGKHYFKDCWIEGHTDFIFGQDAITYFNHCTIYSIGAGENVKNGGYITALKPSVANTYYYVYNGCTFTSDDNVQDGSIALGRAWGADMKMVVINCEISAKYSKAAHTAGTGEGQRYCTMSGNEPKPANMIEANNTGDGAISASIANTCTVDASAAATYGLDNLSTMLGFTPSK